jgi:hypothetical protein
MANAAREAVMLTVDEVSRFIATKPESSATN